MLNGKSKSIACALAAIMMVMTTACGNVENEREAEREEETTTTAATTEEQLESPDMPKPDGIDPDDPAVEPASGAAQPDADENEKFAKGAADFAAGLLRETASADLKSGKNAMVSPVSVMMAMGMTENGAVGSTLAEMQDTLCGGMELDTFNGCMNGIIEKTASSEDVKFNIANGIWLDEDEGITVKDDFRTAVESLYSAKIETSSFKDPATTTQINDWVSEETFGMIPSIIDDLSDARMVLVNATAFEGEWAEKYFDEDIRENKEFHAANGRINDVTMLYSEESVYLEAAGATGFIKDYEGGDYSFMAILPDEGTSIADYVADFTGDDYMALFNSASSEEVHVLMPEFGGEYSANLNDPLKALGINIAFTDDAGFENMSERPLKIGKVLHKTFIQVDRKGTKAAAATAVTMTDTADAIEPDYKEVVLDRPFLYAVIDRDTGLPMFFGVCEECE